MEALFTLALATGMRQGELLGLRWRDVDLDAEVVRVRQALTHDPTAHTYRFKEPKTKHSRRQIALAAPATQALKRQRIVQAEQRLKLGEAWLDQDLVFPNEGGGSLSPRTVHHRLVRLLKQAGLPRIRFHDLRHTAATLLLGARVNPKVVSEMLGHANIAITLDIYSHVLPDMQQDAAAAMSTVLIG